MLAQITAFSYSKLKVLLVLPKKLFLAKKLCTNQVPPPPCMLHWPDDLNSESLAAASHHKVPQCRWLTGNLSRVCHFEDVSRATDLRRQMVPFPTYPGLQVQLCPLTVLVQIAFSSQLCSPLPHSSCSTRGQKESRRENVTRKTASFPVEWCDVWNPAEKTR